MSQPGAVHSYAAAGSKKKKGKVPAHQNSFAFIHNVHSKMTDRITASANTHVCRRCHAKIVWRKQYRKYKPRTAPGKCNLCSKKRVVAAYHTICEPCSRTHSKAVALLAEMNAPKWKKATESTEDDSVDKMEIGVDKIEIAEQEDKVGDKEEEGDDDRDDEEDEDDHNPSSSSQKHYRRVCCICVKEPALLDGDEIYDDEEDPLAPGGRRLKLRERKTIERKQLQESKPKRKSKNKMEDDEDNSNDEDSDNSDGSELGEEHDHDDEHDEDPFIQAIGGADKLLVGDAYQAMLLQRAADAESNANAESK